MWSDMPKVLQNNKSLILLERVEWFVGFLHVVICILLDIHWSYQTLLFWAGFVRYRLSANQIVRFLKLNNLENYMNYQVDFLLPLKLQKISCYFGLCRKILLTNQFVGLFTFDLFDLLILIPGVHCHKYCTCYITLQNYQYNIFSVETISSFCFTIFPECIFRNCFKHLKRFCFECEHTLFKGQKPFFPSSEQCLNGFPQFLYVIIIKWMSNSS